ncbi:MAG: OmpA family protein [Pseudomonadota bacterium]
MDVEPARVQIPRERYVVEPSYAPVDAIYNAATSAPVDELDRTYTLNQVLVNARLRDYMPRIDLDAITFASGSAEIPLSQVDKLETIGVAIEQAIKDNPGEVYLIEGHTDAVGSDVSNLELSDRRASAVADILTSYFGVPPENLVTQGYGERYLKVNTSASEQANRRVAIRRITPLLSKSKDEVAFDDQGNEVFSN